VGHKWKRAEEGSPLISKDAVVPVGNGAIYPRICKRNTKRIRVVSFTF
jgi:hypothetical protein